MIRTKYFIYDHLRNSTGGIIIEYCLLPHDGIYVEMQRGCLEIHRFDSGLNHEVGSSCNGLLLDLGSVVDRFRLGNNQIHVTNPLTKQRAILPSLVQRGDVCFVALAFVETSMKYKVLHTHGAKPNSRNTHIAVLTIGVDKVWRHIDIEHISLPAREALMFSPLVTGGYVHWVRRTFILTLNVETEIISQFSVPQLPKSFPISMGSKLSLIYESGKYLRDVLEMNPETGELTMLFSFDLEPLSYIFKDLRCKDEISVIPLGWLAGGEVFLFRSLQRLCIAYNVKTGETQSFELKSCPTPWRVPHVNGLVWLE